MLLYKFKPFCGPKKFVFKDPDTGFKYLEASEKELVRRIVHYRAQNGLAPIEHLDVVLQNYWCSQPENKGDCCPAKPLKRGLLAYLKGGIALIDNLWYGEKARVPQEEADRRAEICIKCPHNVFPDKKGFILWSDMIAENSVGDAQSKYHHELGSCDLCSCTLKAKVFYNGNMGLNRDQEDTMRSVGCWQPKPLSEQSED